MTLAATLRVTTPTEREIEITRVFDAPRHLVFDCWTKPELLRRWLYGPDGWVWTHCEIDLRVGGVYRFAWQKPGADEMEMVGVYREITRPERIVSTQVFVPDWTGGEAVSTLVLSEIGGRTTVTNSILYSSREARDMALQSGMEEGMAAGYDRMAHVLASLSAR